MRRRSLPKLLTWLLVLLLAGSSFARHHGFGNNGPNGPNGGPNGSNGSDSDGGSPNKNTTQKSPTSVPAADLQALADARAEFDDAHAKSNAAEAALLAVTDKLRFAAIASPEYKAALAEQTASKAAYQAVVQPLQAAAAAKPDYKAAVAQKQQADEAMKTLRDDAGSSSDQITAAAAAVMDAGTKLTQLQADAIANNQNVVDARNREVAADAKVKQLDKDFAGSIRGNPQWIASRTSLDQDKGAEIGVELTLSAALAKVGQTDASRSVAADAARQKQILARDGLQPALAPAQAAN